MKKISYIFVLAMTIVLASCEQDFDTDNIQGNKLEGEWIVKTYINGTNIFGSFPIKTYTSTSDNDSIYINDYEGRFWDFNVKAAVKSSDKTFQTLHSVNTVSGKSIGIRIFKGRIIDNDSINFEIQFEDDETPYGVSYQLAGYRTN